MSGFNSIYPTVRKLRDLQSLVQEDDSVPESVKKGIDKCLEVTLARDEYCQRVSSPLSPVLNTVYDLTLSHPFEKDYEEGKTPFKISTGMITSKLGASFLQTIVSMNNAKKVLEIGMFTGFGALAMAEALPEDGVVFSCEVLPYLQTLAQSMVDKSPHGKKITIKRGDALVTMKELIKEKEQFDFIFIDAAKNEYIDYYKTIMDGGLLAPRGTIAVDNALGHGLTYAKEDTNFGRSIVEFNDFVSKDDRVHQTLVPIRDGVSLIRRKEDVTG